MVPRLDAGMGQFTCASATVDDGTTTREGNRFWLSAMAIANADSAEGEHPFRSKPNTGSSQAEHHRSEATRLLL